MGQSGLYADTYLVWKLRTQAQKTWVAFKTYWTDKFQEHEDINKLRAENAGFRENSAMESETHDKNWMQQWKTLWRLCHVTNPKSKLSWKKNSQLAEQISEKDVTITLLTK